MIDNDKPITLLQVAPELRAGIKKLPRIPISSALGRWLIRTLTKLVFRDRSYAGVHIEKRTISDGVRLRIYKPDTLTSDAALLWIHGGGFVLGSATQDDKFCVETARELGITVISPDYRLAPDFPFPAALDDCYAAWQWLQESASQLNIDKHHIAIGGQSAGGGLAASLVHRIYDGNGIQPVAQWLFSPMLDDRTAALRELDVMDHLVWNNRLNHIGWRAYLGVEPGSDNIPYYAVSARRDNLQGLPATWIGVGDIDLFFNEDQAYADRLIASGVASTFDVVAGAWHGFESLTTDTALTQNYLSRARSWLRDVLMPQP